MAHRQQYSAMLGWKNEDHAFMIIVTGTEFGWQDFTTHLFPIDEEFIAVMQSRIGGAKLKTSIIILWSGQ